MDTDEWHTFADAIVHARLPPGLPCRTRSNVIRLTHIARIGPLPGVPGASSSRIGARPRAPSTHQLAPHQRQWTGSWIWPGDLAIISRIDPDAASTSAVQLAQTGRSLLISSIAIV
jgi:hypothetical protein